MVLLGIAVVAAITGPTAYFAGIDGFASSSTSPSTSSHTMTLAAAKQRDRDNVNAVIGALPVTAQLSPPDGIASGGACSGGLEEAVSGQYDDSVSFRLQGVASSSNQAIFGALRSFAQQRGYKPVSSKPDYESFKDSEGFGVALAESPDTSKTLTLQASSPCVWPNGTPSK